MIGFPIGSTLNATEGITTTVNVCPQLLEGTLERQVSVNVTTSDISARGIHVNSSKLDRLNNNICPYDN